MRIMNIAPRSKVLPDGTALVANFELELADGIVCSLALARSRDGSDLIWSHLSPRGPVIRISRAARADIAALVRAELDAMRVALAQAA